LALGINGGLRRIGELFQGRRITLNRLGHGLIRADGGLERDLLGQQQ
jgi:hypothetical protein